MTILEMLDDCLGDGGQPSWGRLDGRPPWGKKFGSKKNYGHDNFLSKKKYARAIPAKFHEGQLGL